MPEKSPCPLSTYLAAVAGDLKRFQCAWCIKHVMPAVLLWLCGTDLMVWQKSQLGQDKCNEI